MLIAVPTDPATRRILVVDDQADVRDLIVTALKTQRYAVDEASDPEAGLRRLRERRYDLVVAHYGMPYKTAPAMLREAAAEGRLEGTAALVVTAHPSPPDVEPDQLVLKPFDITRFLLQIQRIFQPGAAATAVPAAAALAEQAELVLYVSPGTATSARAVANFKRIAAGFDLRELRFSVRDVTQDAGSAEEDQVVFTPTLVKRRPSPPLWVLGDLSDETTLKSVLEICGAVPRNP